MSKNQILEDVAAPLEQDEISISSLMAIFQEEEDDIDALLKESSFAEGNNLSAQKSLLSTLRNRVQSLFP